MVWIGRLIGMAGLALVWATGVSAAACKPADGKLAGGYELQGVMETGSIIILLADGRFGYNFTVGAYDEIAEGCWHRDGKNVVLVPMSDTTSAMWFTLVHCSETPRSSWRNHRSWYSCAGPDPKIMNRSSPSASARESEKTCPPIVAWTTSA